jgi:hypothetical protein
VRRTITALSGGEYLDPNFFRVSHSQREAGIDQLEWEERIKPLRSLLSSILPFIIATSSIVAGFVFYVVEVSNF